ncbi:non-ribosomal peptide synthetase [Streptomyces sp. NBC_00151]|uniref:non-ribosomal peptide synthetase n=1 Tax=Streptomyces sp. NBC_00151 TaxID=2975669 RepID=UPI002DD8845A|nr:non-ribosomal peptide synthetase [Streptomyces sp. NBC_00151]WRZ40354.1 non-ribosomal peptide synthetase [Streptomyces sp. NBC_00151]
MTSLTETQPVAVGPGTSTSEPAPVLAALAAVLHRGSLQGTVRLAYQDAGGEGLLALTVSEGTTVGELALDAAQQLASGLDEDSVAGAQVDAWFGWNAEPDSPAGALTVAAAPGGFSVRMSDETAAERIASLLRTAMAGAVDVPDTRVSVLPLASAEACAEASALAGDGRATVPARPVHVLVQEQAGRTPDALAVSCAGRSLTYRQLVAEADRVAVRLREAGIRAGQVVGVLAERSLELVTGLLGVLKAGAAYAAFETDTPEQRLRQLLADTGTRVVLAQERFAACVPDRIAVLPLDTDSSVDASDESVLVEVPPTALAYVSFTSGSTGEPKGVCIPHAAVSRLVVQPDWAEFRPSDTFLQLAPVAFDASTLELWAPLVNGGHLVVHPAGKLSTEQLAATLVDENVTVAWMTAGLFQQMVTQHLAAFAGLRHVLAGGDVVPAAHVRRLLEAHPGLVFTNGYGPTENTTFTACWTSDQAPQGNAVPLGRAISGTRAVVRDADQQPVPVGVPGELYAGGEGLAHGYLNRPSATAQSFVPDPDAVTPGARLYRTGDLVRQLADGTLEFLGRADRQVKIQGYRVEPGEIEAVLDHHEDVRQAVVVVQSDGGGGKRLLAYVTAERPEDDNPAALGRRLREWLRGELPGYMVPWAILALPELPLNRNGKVDRSALPAARRAPRALTTEYVAPRTTTEDAMAEEWADLLGVEPVGMDDDFFELGGHSLIAADLLSRLQDRFSVGLSARSLYLRPTVAELAEELDSRPAA